MKSTMALVLAGLLSATAASASEEARAVEVFKTQTCACCVAWIARLEEAGFEIEAEDLPMASLVSMKQELGVPGKLFGCHTAVVAGYVIEGHVPPADIKRLLDSGVTAVGLGVAGMPVGSPGMEYGTRRDAFDVELFDEAGKTSVFASYDERS